MMHSSSTEYSRSSKILWGLLISEIGLMILLSSWHPWQIGGSAITTLLVLGGVIAVYQKREAISERMRRASRLGSGILLGFIATAVAARFVWVFVARTIPIDDFLEYLQLAENIKLHGYFGLDAGPNSDRPVGYPALLSLVIGEESQVSALNGGLLNAMISSLTLVPIYLWARSFAIHFGAALSVAVFAWLPSQILGVSILATEPLFTFLIAWVLFFCSKLSSPRAPIGWAIGAAVSTAGAIYVRPQGEVVLPACCAFALVFSSAPRQLTLRWYSVAIAISLVLLVPWGIRNNQSFGHFSLTTSAAGLNAYMANNSNATGGQLPLQYWPEKPPPESDPYSQGAKFNEKAIEWVRSHPVNFVALIPKKWSFVFRSEQDMVDNALTACSSVRLRLLLERVAQVMYSAVLLLAGAGVLAHRKLRLPSEAVPAAAIITAWFMVRVWFHGEPRYHAPLLPALSIMAALLFCDGDRSRGIPSVLISGSPK
jgi:4-amino-4-deoxy-L-arabinose transferase-like glycosyltransferase